MVEEKKENEYRPKPSRASKNIQFARGLSFTEMHAILQNALMEARNLDRKHVEVMTEIVHEIKFRLQYYFDEMGEIKHDDYYED